MAASAGEVDLRALLHKPDLTFPTTRPCPSMMRQTRPSADRYRYRGGERHWAGSIRPATADAVAAIGLPAAEGIQWAARRVGLRNYVNPPFGQNDVVGRQGATAFVQQGNRGAAEGQDQRDPAANVRLRDHATGGWRRDTAALG